MLAESKVSELELRLCRYLDLPVTGQREQRSVPAGKAGLVDLAPLWQAVRDLELASAQIGKVPGGYPRHLDIVMRLISALLPWYTRPLAEFGRQTAKAVRQMAEILTEMAGSRK